MKTIFRLLTAFMIMISVSMTAQDYISSNVKLSKEAIGKITSVMSENVVIKLNEQNDEFTFSLRLYPILAGINENDSIASLNQKIILDYKGVFPIDNLSFFEAGNNGKRYTLKGDLTVNNITKPHELDFYLQESLPQDISTMDIHTYPVRISLALEFNPAEFGLDNETAKFTEKITIVIADGIINKSENESF
jgi:hypothetical protein